jgi:hypothetical protein
MILLYQHKKKKKEKDIEIVHGDQSSISFRVGRHDIYFLNWPYLIAFVSLSLENEVSKISQLVKNKVVNNYIYHSLLSISELL